MTDGLSVDSTRGETVPGPVIEVPGTRPPDVQPAPDFSYVPQKHVVKRPDGTTDPEATLRRVEGHRVALEKRIGTGDLRPESASDYVYELPEGKEYLADAMPTKERMEALRAEMFEAGFTQKQFEFALNEYFDQAPRLARAFHQVKAQEAVAELRAIWPTDAEFNTNIAHAKAAIEHYAGDDAEAILRDYGSESRIAKMMAKLGAELRFNDAPPPTSDEDIAYLSSHPAYRDPKHPEHQRVSDQLSRLMQRKYGTEAVGV